MISSSVYQQADDSVFALQHPLMYPLTSALKTYAVTECDQFCSCWVKIALRQHGPIIALLHWSELGPCLAPGDETDGISSCRSEHKTPEHLLQSVVPVLNINRSKTLPRCRVGEGHPPPASQAFSFPDPSALNHLISHLFLQWICPLLLPLLHLVLSLCTYTPLWLRHVSVTQSHLSLPANITSRPYPVEHAVQSVVCKGMRESREAISYWQLAQSEEEATYTNH